GQHQQIELAGLVEIEPIKHADIEQRAARGIDDRRDRYQLKVRNPDVAVGKLSDLAAQKVMPLMVEAQPSGCSIEPQTTHHSMRGVAERGADRIKRNEIPKGAHWMHGHRPDYRWAVLPDEKHGDRLKIDRPEIANHDWRERRMQSAR